MYKRWRKIKALKYFFNVENFLKKSKNAMKKV